ncbi:MAG: FHA domain-containing protein [Actinobacteria bacterium]|nr:FHA domain-containing protein [Actinomycetota bacterium]
MSESSKQKPVDLTATIHLNQLRSVPDAVNANNSENSTSFEQNYLNQLKKLPPDTQAVIEKLKEDQALLVISKGPGIGARFLVNKPEIYIGREMKNDVVLDDITVSRSHVVIKIDNVSNSLSLKDLGSLNGTYVNSVIRAQSVLKPGDEIQIGKFHLNIFTKTAKKLTN